MEKGKSSLFSNISEDEVDGSKLAFDQGLATLDGLNGVIRELTKDTKNKKIKPSVKNQTASILLRYYEQRIRLITNPVFQNLWKPKKPQLYVDEL